MELTDAMRSTHANRYYKSDPVPTEVFYKAVEVARFGPQGGNRQPVRFLIVTDPEKKAQLQEWYLEPWNKYMEASLAGIKAIDTQSGDQKATTTGMKDPAKAFEAANHFAQNFGKHPAIIVVLADIEETHPTDTDLGRLSIVGGASVYPLAQNLCLALRNEGVATTFTTLLCAYEPQVKELLDIPENLSCAAFIAAGYPEKPFPTKLTRRPVEEIAFIDSLDNPVTDPAHG
jgi:nitroreductase